VISALTSITITVLLAEDHEFDARLSPMYPDEDQSWESASRETSEQHLRPSLRTDACKHTKM